MGFWRRLFGGSSGDELKPQRLDYLNEALALERQGDYEAALTSYRLALRDHPNDARILQNMAIAFTKTRRLDEAIRHYRRAPEAPQRRARARLQPACRDRGGRAGQRGRARHAPPPGARPRRPGPRRVRRHRLGHRGRRGGTRGRGQHDRSDRRRATGYRTPPGPGRRAAQQPAHDSRACRRRYRVPPGTRSRHRDPLRPRLPLRLPRRAAAGYDRHRRGESHRPTHRLRPDRYLSLGRRAGHAGHERCRLRARHDRHGGHERGARGGEGADPPRHATGQRRGAGGGHACRGNPRARLSGQLRRGGSAMSTGSLPRLFFDAVERHAGRPAAFRSKVGGVWTSITHRDAEARVRAIAVGLRELGIRAGDRVAIVSESRPERMLADFACLCAQCTDVPVYPTLPAGQIEYILRDSGAVAAFCSTADQAGKLVAVQASLATLRHLIVFDPKAKRGQAMSLAELEQRGRAAEGKYPTFRQDALAAHPQDLATLIYTSGTTGEPKGVMLSHVNICSNVDAALQVVPISSRGECLAMLPLAHIFERMVDYTLFKAGAILNYAESFEAVPTNLPEVRPTIVVTLPRLFGKGYAPVLENALSGSGLKRRIFFLAERTGGGGGSDGP